MSVFLLSHCPPPPPPPSFFFQSDGKKNNQVGGKQRGKSEDGNTSWKEGWAEIPRGGNQSCARGEGERHKGLTESRPERSFVSRKG